MVNQAQVGVVNLRGRGFANKPFGGYLPGEFSRLYNCELTEYGSLVRRKGIANCEAFPQTYTNKRRWAGSWGKWAILAPRMGQTSALGVSLSSVNSIPLNAPDAESCRILNGDGTLFVDASTYTDAFDNKNWHPFVTEGFVRYNKVNYWLGAGVVSTVAAGAYTYRKAVITVAKRNDGQTYQDSLDLNDCTVFAAANQYDMKIIGTIDVSGDATDTFSILPKVVEGGFAFPIINHFIHKDRLWIVTPTQLYFSKATDPFEFRVSQDGGFISMADAQIKYAVPVGDSIYIFSDSKIDLLTYQTSPNVDGQVSRISSALGADSACEHKGKIYFAKYNALYEISGTRVDKVMDLNLNVEAGSTSANGRTNLSKYYRISSYYNYLIIGNVARTYGTANPGAENVLGANKNSQYFIGYSAMDAPCPDLTARPDGFGPKIPTNFFMVNTDTGGIMELGYHPDKTLRGQSCISEVFVVTNENSQNQQTLFLSCLDNSALGVKGATGGNMGFFFMWPPTYQNSGLTGQYFQDTYYTGNGGFPQTIAFVVNGEQGSVFSKFVLRDIAPDQLEYNIKKLRSFMVEGTIVNKGLAFTFSFDDSAVTAPVTIGPNPTSVPPVGFRTGLNQRARAFNICMTDDPDFVNNIAFWEIFDLRFLWTYTGRAPVGRT